LTDEDHGPWVPVEEPCGHPDCEFPMCDCEVAPVNAVVGGSGT
jgi:hypothetical protein